MPLFCLVCMEVVSSAHNCTVKHLRVNGGRGNMQKHLMTHFHSQTCSFVSYVVILAFFSAAHHVSKRGASERGGKEDEGRA